MADIVCIIVHHIDSIQGYSIQHTTSQNRLVLGTERIVLKIWCMLFLQDVSKNASEF